MSRTKPAHIAARLQPASQAEPDDDWDDTPEQTEQISPYTGKPKRKYQRKKRPEQILPGKRKRKGKGQVKHRTPMSDIKWRNLLSHLSNGLTRNNAIDTVGVTRQTFESFLVTNVNAPKQLREAEAVWLRRSWSTDDIDEILNKIAMGMTVKRAAREIGYDDNKIARFYQLVRRDRTMREWYDEARELQAESWVDDNVDIADETEQDWYEDAKGKPKTNHEVIQRSKLRVETRQWTMAAMNRKRFGQHQHIDHGGDLTVNHAVVLSQARKRLESARGGQTEGASSEPESTKQGRETIDGQYSRVD